MSLSDALLNEDTTQPHERPIPSSLPVQVAPHFVFPDSPWHEVVLETAALDWPARRRLLAQHKLLELPLRFFGFVEPISTPDTSSFGHASLSLTDWGAEAEDEHVVSKGHAHERWPRPWRLMVTSVLFALGFAGLTFGYPGGPLATTAELGGPARVDIHSFFDMIFSLLVPFTVYGVVHDPMFCVLLQLSVVHDAKATGVLIRRYFWAALGVTLSFFALTMTGFSVFWNDIPEFPVPLRFVNMACSAYYYYLFAFALILWMMVAHMCASLIDDITDSLEPDQFFATIDRTMRSSSIVVHDDDATHNHHDFGKRMRTMRESKSGIAPQRLGAIFADPEVHDKKQATRVIQRVVESRIRQFHQAGTIVQYMFSRYQVLLLLKTITDVTLLFFGLAGVLDGGHQVLSTLLVIVVSLVVVVMVLGPAAYLTSLQRDVIFAVANLRPFATQPAQRVSIESMINYLLPFSRRGGVRFFGMPITPSLVVNMATLFYSLIAAANFLR